MSKLPHTIRAAVPSDYPQIAALMDRAFGPRPLDQRLRLWSWRHERNPARVASMPGFMVLEIEGRILGAHGLVPLRISAGGCQMVASCSADFAVAAEARSAGLQLKLRALSKDFSPLHISTSANEAANKITLALGGKEVECGRHKMMKLLRIHTILRKRVGGGGAPGCRALGILADFVIGRPGNLALAIGRTAQRSVKAPMPIENFSRFDRRFDDLWQHASTRGKIMVVRDASYLNWRYADYPFSGIDSFCIASEEAVSGFAVMHVTRDSRGIPTAAILELLARDDEPRVLGQLLQEIVRRATSSGAHYIVARTADPPLEALLARDGFHSRTGTYSTVTYKNNTDLDPALFAAGSNWYVSLGDGDICYYFDEPPVK